MNGSYLLDIYIDSWLVSFCICYRRGCDVEFEKVIATMIMSKLGTGHVLTSM